MSMRNDRWRIWEQLYGGANPTGQGEHDPSPTEVAAKVLPLITDPVGDAALAAFIDADPTRRWIGLDAWRRNAPDWHPGWDRLRIGFNRITRTHGMPGHRCQVCDQLNRQLGRLPDRRRRAA